MINLPRLINYAALPVLLVATWLGLQWPWGLVFLWWAVPSIRSGQAFLIDTVNREADPLLFWTVTVLWVVFGGLMVTADIAPAVYPAWLV
ncbi:hypothetical protein [Ruegeria arenilitoris]|uniref:hypothetical protein n=1 Tax=Ruegeria arenilitoris TaxID=1173585 RepID=UPI001480F51F|nr:hypothetical protein [Ruegeria arenilitoris]